MARWLIHRNLKGLGEEGRGKRRGGGDREGRRKRRIEIRARGAGKALINGMTVIETVVQ